MYLRASVSMATAVLLSTSALAAAAPAGAATQPVRSVSPGDPFTECTIGAASGSVANPSAEVEPWVAADRRDPRRAIGVFQQDRWSDGGAKGLVASYTRDGRHFAESLLPFSACVPGGLGYQRASDAWADFGPDGVAYANGLSFDQTTARSAVASATSYDGGRTWTHAQAVIADDDPTIFNDKNSITADPVHPGVAYQVWDRIDQVASGPGAHYDGPAYIAITHDHGRTWTRPRPFVDTSAVPFSQTIGNVIVADPRTGVLYDFFEWQSYSDVTATKPTDLHFAVVRSADQGRTWSRPVTVARDTSVPEVDPNAPDDASKALRAGSELVSAAIDPRTGELYAAYEGSDFTGGRYDDVQLVYSTDGGRTWSAPVRINQAPNAPAFTPAIAVDARGTVAVTYYDLRYLRPGDTTTLPTAMWYVTFPRGGERSVSERRISRVFDWLRAPYAGWGHFLGDYAGLATVRGGFRPIFAEAGDASSTDPTDIFSGLLAAPRPGPAATAAAATPGTPRAARVAHRFRH